MKLKPGLSSYDQEPELAGVSITELLQFAEKHVPDSLWSSTPVYLFAYDLRVSPTVYIVGLKVQYHQLLVSCTP